MRSSDPRQQSKSDQVGAIAHVFLRNHVIMCIECIRVVHPLLDILQPRRNASPAGVDTISKSIAHSD